jgi:hypothetical protein
MKLDTKNTRGGVITMWGEEEEASLWVIEIPGLFSMSCAAG